jgi:transposase-like protein
MQNMGRKRRTISDNFKAKVALEAIKGVKTSAELAAEYKVHTNQISAWKKQLKSEASSLFSKQKSRSERSEEEISAPLFEEIGRLKMELKWLEKKL